MVSRDTDWSTVNWEVAGASMAERAYDLSRGCQKGASDFYDEFHKEVLKVRRCLQLGNRKPAEVDYSHAELSVLAFFGFSYLVRLHMRTCPSEEDNRIVQDKVFALLASVAHEIGLYSFHLFVERHAEIIALLEDEMEPWCYEDVGCLCDSMAQSIINSWINGMIGRETGSRADELCSGINLDSLRQSTEKTTDLAAMFFEVLSTSCQEQIDRSAIDKLGPNMISG
jgi:hypothetical protein